MAGNYVKLFGSLLNSSVWCGSIEVKVTWVTMLLLADPNGRVWGAVPGIARQAGIDVEAARQAIAFLCAPDPDSRTPDHEGRRLLVIEGGWKIANAEKYRDLQTDGQRRASQRSKRYRANKASRVTHRDDRDASRLSRTEKEKEKEPEVEVNGLDEGENVSGAVAPADGPTPVQRVLEGHGNSARKATAKASTPKALAVISSPSWSKEAAVDWDARFGVGSCNAGRIGKALSPLVTVHGWDKVRPAWTRYLREKEPEFASAQDFAGKFAVWAGTSGRERTNTPGELPEQYDAETTARVRAEALERYERLKAGVTP